MPNFSIIRFIQEGIIPDPGTGMTHFLCESLSNSQSPIPGCNGPTFVANTSLCETLAQYLSAADRIIWHPDVITRGLLTGDQGVIILLRVLSFVAPHAAELDERYLFSRDETFVDFVMQAGHALSLALSFRRSVDFARLELERLAASTNASTPRLLIMMNDLINRFTLFVGRSLSDLKV